MVLLWAHLGAGARETVTVWHTYRGEERAALDRAAEVWGEAHGVTVENVALPFGGFEGKIEAAIPRGNGPDLFVAPHDNLGKWAPMGLVEPWADAEPLLAEQRPATAAAVRRDGEVWGAPLAFKSIVLLYDPTKVASPPADTDALVASARALTGDGAYGLAYPATEPYFQAPWMHAFGAKLLDDDGVSRLDGPGHAEALAFARRLAVDEGIAPLQPTVELVTRLYDEGKVAYTLNGPWFVAEVHRPVAAAPLPVVSETGRPAAPYLTVDVAYVATHARHPDEARAYAAWLAGPEGATLRRDVGHQAVSAAAVSLDADPLLAVLAAQAAAAVPMPADPVVASAFEAEARALRDVMRGAATPARAAAAAARYVTILSRPPPPAVSPAPYVALVVAVVLGLVAAALAPYRRAAARAELWAHRWDYVWVLPAAVALSVLVVAPFVVGASVSLFEHTRGTWSFVGLANFVAILASRDFPVTSPMSFGFTLAVTVLWTVTNVALHAGIGFALALALREPWIRLRAVWRAVLVIPWAIPNYITALVWKGMFHAQYGAVNALLGLVLLRGEPLHLDWFGSFATAFAANLTTNTWLGFPFMMVVTLGALQSMPKDLEEAAAVDGASYLFRVRHVIWPLVKPALLPALAIGSVWTFNMFNVVFLVSQGEPNGATEILVSDVYRWAFSRGNRYGYAAAYAVIIFFVLVAYSRVTDHLLGRRRRAT